MKAKHEVIQQHYIDLLNAEKFVELERFIDEEGWCTMFDERETKVSPTFKELGFNEDWCELVIDTAMKEGCWVWRPKSLKGIETNNGWTRIQSEADLPSDNTKKYIPCENGVPRDDYMLTLKDLTNGWNCGYITHYKAVDLSVPLFINNN